MLLFFSKETMKGAHTGFLLLFLLVYQVWFWVSVVRIFFFFFRRFELHGEQSAGEKSYWTSCCFQMCSEAAGASSKLTGIWRLMHGKQRWRCFLFLSMNWLEIWSKASLYRKGAEYCLFFFVFEDHSVTSWCFQRWGENSFCPVTIKCALLFSVFTSDDFCAAVDTARNTLVITFPQDLWTCLHINIQFFFHYI